MTCIIINNHLKDCDVLAKYIFTTTGLNLGGVFHDVGSAQKALEEQKADLIFMEIATPGHNVLDFLKSAVEDQSVILTSASPGFAVDAFELGVTDYLLKPFTQERFLKAVNRAMNHNRPGSNLSPDKNPDYFFVKADNKFEKIRRGEILYIESLQNYIIIQTLTKRVITYSSLKSIEKYLCEKEFIRVQRSFIVAISQIDSITGADVVIGETNIPISRATRNSVLKTVLSNRLYSYN